MSRELGPYHDEFPSFVLYAYRLGQLDAFLYRVDGYYCASIYDPIRSKIFLISDRFGMRMLYWYHRNGVFAWASEVKGILALPGVEKKIDTTSLPCFMDLGYLMGEHTWFEHIRLVKPASIMELDTRSQKLSQRYYWTWGEISPSNLAFDDAVDALYEAFMASVKRRFYPQERIGISLSGGLDSRAIFAAVNQLYPGLEGYAYTFGTPDCDDIRIARQVVSRSSWRHEVFFFSSDDWFLPRIPLVWDTDGMLNIMHMHGGNFIPREKTDINLNGYLGDVVAGGGWVNRLPLNKRATKSDLLQIYKDYVWASMVDDEYFNINCGEPVLYMSRARRFTNMGTVNVLSNLDQRKPFFDNEVINCLFSMPEKYRMNNRVYSECLKRYFPKFFVDIPWQKTQKPAGIVSKPRVFTRAVRKLKKITYKRLGLNDTHEYTDYQQWLREPNITAFIMDLLNYETSSYKELTHIDFVEKYVKPHQKYFFRDFSKEILLAATIEIYLRRLNNRSLPVGLETDIRFDDIGVQ